MFKNKSASITLENFYFGAELRKMNHCGRSNSNEHFFKSTTLRDNETKFFQNSKKNKSSHCLNDKKFNTPSKYENNDKLLSSRISTSFSEKKSSTRSDFSLDLNDIKKINFEPCDVETINSKEEKNFEKIITQINSNINTNQILNIGNRRILIAFNNIIDKVLCFHIKKESNNNKFNIYNSFELEERFSVGEYINRISRLVSKNNEVYTIMAIITFDNFLNLNRSFKVTKNNIYIILALCFSISIKSNSDTYIQSEFLSILTYTSQQIFFEIEMQFFEQLDYKTTISSLRFSEYKENLYKKIDNKVL